MRGEKEHCPYFTATLPLYGSGCIADGHGAGAVHNTYSSKKQDSWRGQDFYLRMGAVYATVTSAQRLPNFSCSCQSERDFLRAHFLSI